MASLSSAATAELVKLAWDSGGRFEQSLSVPKGAFVEVCGRLEVGQTVAWKFRADNPLNFNIHYHEGKNVIYPEQRDAAQELAGTLSVRIEQDYCWMWSNKTDTSSRIVVTMSK